MSGIEWTDETWNPVTRCSCRMRSSAFCNSSRGGERRISRNADLPGAPRRGQSPRVFTCSDVAAHLSPLAFARQHQTVDGGF